MPWLTPDSLPANGEVVCRQLRIPNDTLIIAAVNGALLDLTYPENWEPLGAITPDEMAAAMLGMVLEYLNSTCMIGAILPYVTQQPPANCLPCDGSLHLRVDYPVLYQVIDPAYIVDADTFRTPDLRDVFLLGAGSTYQANSSGGAASVSLTADQNGPHSHTTQPHSHTTQPHVHSEVVPVPIPVNGGVEAPAPSAEPGPSTTGPAVVAVDPASVVVDSSGLGEAHENMPPYRALNYCLVAR